jgi:hypothetical protein
LVARNTADERSSVCWDGRGRAEIIRCRHTVEMFSPPSVEKVNHERRVPASDGREDGMVLWIEHPKQDDTVIVVYVGPAALS